MGGGSSSAPEVKETAAEIALAETSAKKWSDYKTNFVPLENQYIQRVNDMGKQSSIDKVGNAAAGQAMTQFKAQNSGLTHQNFGRNLDPTSGAFKSKSIALNSAIQQTKQNATNNGQFAAENAHIQGLGNVVAMGEGEEGVAFNSMASLANQSAGQAINDAKSDFTQYQGDQEAVGAVVGGLSAYGMDYTSGNQGLGENPFKDQSLTVPQQGWQAPDTRYAQQNAKQPNLFSGGN